MAYKIDEVEGIGEAYRGKLGAASVKTTADLLEQCGTPQGRKAVSEKTGVSEKVLLNWTNKADLMRIGGVGPQFSELLEAAGVDTVKELRNRNADNLATKMDEVNQQKNLANASPSASTVSKWVDEAKTLDPIIKH